LPVWESRSRCGTSIKKEGAASGSFESTLAGGGGAMAAFHDSYLAVRNVLKKLCMVVVYLSSISIPLILVYQSLYRYLFRKPVLGLEELSVFLMVLLTLFGSVVLFYEKKHIIVDAFLKFIPARLNKVFQLLNDLLLVIIFGFLIRSCLLALPLQKVYKTVVLGIPKVLITSLFLGTLVVILVDYLVGIAVIVNRWKESPE
jgi:TRAP-type C4-dicarboxylate transport system permease small subunit